MALLQHLNMSQFQLISYQRIEDYFVEQVGLALSAGSVFNFNKEAYEQLEAFEAIAKEKLIASPCLHVDETGINVNGQRLWLHTACTNKWTHFYPHAARGSQATHDTGILPKFQGVLCHDHWKAYYTYTCLHALCNAHPLRELAWASTHGQQQWAACLSQCLVALNKKVDAAGVYLKRSHVIIIKNVTECSLKKRSRNALLPIQSVKRGNEGE